MPWTTTSTTPQDAPYVAAQPMPRVRRCAQVCVAMGASLFGVLGVSHAWMTLSSEPHTGPMTPTDPATQEVMTRVGGLGFAPDAQVVFWDAWQGFHLSHSLGVLLFALVALGGVFGRRGRAPTLGYSLLLALTPLVYLAISMRYWFEQPTHGIALGVLLLEAGVLLDVVSRVGPRVPPSFARLGARHS
ncbi:MAG: hypothetical protein AAGI01_07140 [Myxococcota bacterium]